MFSSIVKACRGVKFDNGVNLQVARDVTDSGRFKTVKIPVFADFMIAYSCMPGSVNIGQLSVHSNVVCDAVTTHGVTQLKARGLSLI